MQGPWGPMDPNSTHQRWSKWMFVIRAHRKRPSKADIIDNARRFFALTFRSTVGQVMVDVWRNTYTIYLVIEGPAAHDPSVQDAIERQFREHFICRGFGVGARLEKMEVGLLAGSREDGRPPDQLIVMPRIDWRSTIQKDY